MVSLCRDCLAVKTEDFDRCPVCFNLRVVRHPALAILSIAHVDCDAFYAAVEKRDNPALRDRPLIVGAGTRGVVTTCCYQARLYGVRSAMPMFKALKLCPDAVVVPPDFPRYHEAGRAIRARMEALTPLVQPVSIDEAYLDLSGTERLHGLAPAVAELARCGLAGTQIHRSVWVAWAHVERLDLRPGALACAARRARSAAVASLRGRAAIPRPAPPRADRAGRAPPCEPRPPRRC
jgi:hypothetical protein